MSNHDDTRGEVVDRLVDYITEKLPGNEAPLLKNFIRQYYLSVSPEDITSKSVLDLYGAVLSHWHFISQRNPGEAKVRAYNPDLEQHGWQSTHTVIEIGFDDMPFLVDSVTIELNRLELNIHLIIHMGSIKLRRDAEGHITEVSDNINAPGEWLTEAAIYIEIDRQSDKEVLDSIAVHLKDILNDVHTVVEDWPKMRQEAAKLTQQLEAERPPIEPSLFNESIEFIRWVVDDHFTFMGYQAFDVLGEGQDIIFELVPNLSLGLLLAQNDKHTYHLSEFTKEAQILILSEEIIMLGKTNQRSKVHRPAYTDFIVIKIVDPNGKLKKIHRFDGLYTAVAYNSSPQYIPYLRRKVTRVLQRAGFPPKSHDDRALLNILETLPRDDLFQATEDELLSLCTGILHLQERQKIRLFIRRETFGNFFSCLVFVPRDAYNSTLREKMQEILIQGTDGKEVQFTTRFSESSLARIHFVIRIDQHHENSVDVKQLEQKLIEAGRTWKDDLRDALYEHCGEEHGNELFKRFGNAFPAGYCEVFPARIAVVDIDYFEALSLKHPLMMSLYRPLEDNEETIRFKLFRSGLTIPLSDVVPILERLGLRIISERPYEIIPKTGPSIWINDYRMMVPKGQTFDAEDVREIFQEAFDHIWRGEAENDGFNRLVLTAKLGWQEIMILRAYAKYFWQIGSIFSQNYIEDTLCHNYSIAFELIQLFKIRFDPDYQATETELHDQKNKIERSLEQVVNLDEDRILRRYLQVILATLRTNYYQKDQQGAAKPYFSFKVDSSKVPEIPSPIPLYEIFVYSPRVEAIHLRGAKVARGGIRWSDRKEDFRTEVLGLMKAQQVKNAVIVPMGAKGGFVVKRTEITSRDELLEEAIFCYQTLIRGLLDITDNLSLKDGNVIYPRQVVRYDEDDPYLVVAADKGTASFSDIANAISKEYDFWLGDAFASGGSAGYDHKKMGITARGAWVSVKRHFHEMSWDTQTQDFTVIGIGDMSGDVFGNGMLLSRHIKLVAAFNHMHIFLDPNPDPEQSFNERERLFYLPRSGWSDYKEELISTGGGVFARNAKSIILSKEIQEALNFYQERVVPNELIRAILKAPMDLLWNGGIGTYVKASTESNNDVGDRMNDALRVNGADLRCKVVGEGGNLGLTQLGRVEYALLGGRLNTDAIDNSGGVNCSDNEVNIKILLNDVVECGDLTEKKRNELLVSMEDEVAELVLYNNRRQTEAISVAVAQAPENLEMHSRLIQELERAGNLDRALEFLPDKEVIADRKAKNLGLTRPEIAVLMAYSKNNLKKSLLSSDVLEDPIIAKELFDAFPKPLQAHFKDFMNRHRLKREIIATRVSNAVINEMGISFVARLQDETGSAAPDIIRAFTASRKIFEANVFHTAINALNGTVEASVQVKMLQEVNRLVRRGTRWFLRNRRTGLNISDNIKQFSSMVIRIADVLPNLLEGSEYDLETTAKNYIEVKVPNGLAYRIAGMTAMFSALDIVEAAIKEKFEVEQVAALYYALGTQLDLGWFRGMIKKHPISNHWEALARAAFRDDLDREQRNLAVAIMHQSGADLKNIPNLIEIWLKKNRGLVARWKYFVSELKNTPEADFTMFSVALRELLDMAQITTQKKK